MVSRVCFTVEFLIWSGIDMWNVVGMDLLPPARGQRALRRDR
jgi:hypothetical protein